MRKFLSRFKPVGSAVVKFLRSAKARPAEIAAARFALKHLVASGVLSAAVAVFVEQWLR